MKHSSIVLSLIILLSVITAGYDIYKQGDQASVIRLVDRAKDLFSDYKPQSFDIKDRYSINVGSKTIKVDSSRWKKMDDPEAYAKNFEETRVEQYRKFPRVVTVFLLPMTDKDRAGAIRLSGHEYLEIFSVIPGLIIVKTKVEKGDYWVLCRETFIASEFSSITPIPPKPFLSDEEKKLLWMDYDFANEINKTRFLLNREF